MPARPSASAEASADANPCQTGLDALLATLGERGVDRIGVAYSGGADSTALLLAAQRRWPGRIVALHINHGMQAAAADFERHCQAFCDEREIPLQIARLQLVPPSGASPEDWARKARYAELRELAGVCAIKNIVLAQHADDQVETLLLALSRGAGLPGLAAMAPSFERADVHFHRPILAVSGQALRHWLVAARVACVVDPSNAAQGLTRHRIRHPLLPVLEQAFPAFRDTFARSARHAAQGQVLLSQLAVLDAERTGLPPSIKALQALPAERQANLLRHWLAQDHQCAPSAAQLDELLKQIAACTTRGHRLSLKIGAGWVRRVAGALRYERASQD